MDEIIIFITCATLKEANKISDKLLTLPGHDRIELNFL